MKVCDVALHSFSRMDIREGKDPFFWKEEQRGWSLADSYWSSKRLDSGAYILLQTSTLEVLYWKWPQSDLLWVVLP